MSGINLDKLREYGQTGDVELRLTQTDDPDKPKIETREGTWHGRLVRNLKIDWEKDRSQKQVEYSGAHNEVWKALREAYGEEIGEKAFRAGGFGGQDQDGNWLVDSNHPITGRHIEKMLAFGDKEYAREIARNRGIGEWIGALRHDGSSTPDVTLGEKVSQPRGTIKKEDAFRNLGGDLNDAIDDWHRGTKDQHAFLILDLTIDGAPRRIGIHVDRNNPDRLQLLGLDGDYNVNIPKGQFPEWLSQHLDGRTVSSMALYRAQEDTTRQLSERVTNAWRALEGGAIGGAGVKTWIPKAMEVIEETGRLLRSNSSTPGNTQDLKLQVDLQLAQINKYLNDGDVVTPTQTYLDERYSFSNGFRTTLVNFLEQNNIRDRPSQEKIYRELTREAEAFLGELRATRGSLSDEQMRNELVNRLGSRLGQLLEERGSDQLDRDDSVGRARSMFTELLTELNDTVFTPLRQSLDTTVEPLRLDITRELEKQRELLEAKSKSLEVGTQVEYGNERHLETKGILKPEGSRGTGQSVRVRDRVEVAPLQLSFTKQGDIIVATVPHLFSGVRQESGRPGRYESPGQTRDRSLDWGTVVQNHQERLNQDKSGVPGSGKERDVSLPIYMRTSTGGVDLKIGDTEILSLTELELTDGPGDENLLTREQYCGLTRFLNDKAFQDVYAQAVRRLYPPGEDGPRDTECREIGIFIDISVGEDGRQMVDITFRGELPGDENLRYQALPQDGVLPQDAPELEVDSDYLVLSMTMHVPFDQLRSERPQVTIDQPGIVFLEVPDDYQTDLHLPQEDQRNV